MAEQALTWGRQHFDNATEWGRDLERRHAWLLHQGSLAVGQVERFYTGEGDDVYMSTLDGLPVKHGVFVLSTGHALLSKPDNFIEIGPEDAVIYATTLDKLRKAIVDAVTEAGTQLRGRGETPPELPMALIIAALRAQTHALEATIEQQRMAQAAPEPTP